MKNCIKKISPGDVIRWRMRPEAPEQRFLVMSRPNLFHTHFHVDCREWHDAEHEWKGNLLQGDFADRQVSSIEKARR